MSETDPAPEISLREKLRTVAVVAAYRPGTMVTIVLLSVLVTVLEGVGLGFLFPILQYAQGGAAAPPAASNDGPVALFVRFYEFLGVPFTLEFVIGGVALVMTARIAMGFLVGFLGLRLGTEYVRDLQTRAFESVLRSRPAFFDEHGSDVILNTLVSRVYYAESVVEAVVGLVLQGSLAVLYLGVALYLAPVPTALLGSAFLVLVYVLRSQTESAYAVGDEVDRAHEAMQHTLQAGTQGVREVQLFGLSGELSDDFRRAVGRYTRSTIRLGRNGMAMNRAYNLLSTLLVFSVIYLGLSYSSLSIDRLGVFLFAVYRAAPKINQVNSYVYSLEGSLPQLVRTWAYVDEFGDSRPSGDTEALGDGSIERVAFDDVTFAYDDEQVLDGVSFVLDRDEVVALVGPSGAGKSTIASLLLRLYEPDEGRILVDGRPTSRVDVDDWRSRVALVPQNPYIFDETLRYNLTVGARDASEAEVERAAETAQVSEFLDELPDGYETAVGDDGTRLSGGQRQRVAIARALLVAPEILVLDEGTSDLDDELEARVFSRLDAAERSLTVLAISHRRSTLRNADRIVSLKRGTVTEYDTLEELLDVERTSADLFSSQSDG